MTGEIIATIRGGSYIELDNLAFGSTVDFGDGSSPQIYNGNAISRNSNGNSSNTFTLRITGDPYNFKKYQTEATGENLTALVMLGGFISIDKWDIGVEWIRLHNPTNTSHILQSVPNLPKSVICTENMFSRCNGFNQDISHWDMSKVSNVASMFSEATSFNQNLSGWDVSNVLHHQNFDSNTPSWILPKPNFSN